MNVIRLVLFDPLAEQRQVPIQRIWFYDDAELGTVGLELLPACRQAWTLEELADICELLECLTIASPPNLRQWLESKMVHGELSLVPLTVFFRLHYKADLAAYADPHWARRIAEAHPRNG